MHGACSRHVGVTNFDVPRLKEIVDSGVRIVSNQVLCTVLSFLPEAALLAISEPRFPPLNSTHQARHAKKLT